jgi:hypothetical protein
VSVVILLFDDNTSLLALSRSCNYCGIPEEMCRIAKRAANDWHQREQDLSAILDAVDASFLSC